MKISIEEFEELTTKMKEIDYLIMKLLVKYPPTNASQEVFQKSNSLQISLRKWAIYLDKEGEKNDPTHA